MEIDIIINNDSATLTLKGDIVSEVCPQIREKVMDLVKNNILNLSLDFKDTPFIDSAGLGMLIGIKSTLNSKKGHLKIRNINARIKDIFTITRMDKLFDLGDD